MHRSLLTHVVVLAVGLGLGVGGVAVAKGHQKARTDCHQFAGAGGSHHTGGHTSRPPRRSGPTEPFGGSKPASGGSFGGGTQRNHSASDAIDGDPSTYWLTNEAGSGIWISTSNSQWSRIGIQPKSGHTGFVVQVYGSNHKPTSAKDVTDGVAVGSKHKINGATKLKLGGTDFAYYSLYVVEVGRQSADAGITELSLIP